MEVVDNEGLDVVKVVPGLKIEGLLAREGVIVSGPGADEEDEVSEIIPCPTCVMLVGWDPETVKLPGERIGGDVGVNTLMGAGLVAALGTPLLSALEDVNEAFEGAVAKSGLRGDTAEEKPKYPAPGAGVGTAPALNGPS